MKDQSWVESDIPIFDDWKSAANDLLVRKWGLPEGIFTIEGKKEESKPELVEKKRKVSDGQLRPVTVDETGTEVGDSRLKEAGFEIGILVTRKLDRASAEIEELLPQVILKMGEKKFIIDRQAFLKEWKVGSNKHTTRSEPLSHEQYTSWEDHVAIGKIKAACIIEIASAGERMGKVEDMFTITSKPKDVISIKSHAKGKLMIPPVTTRIFVETGDEERATGILLGNTTVNGVEAQVFAQQPSFYFPFWMMKTSSNQDEANMDPRIQVLY